MNPDEIDRSALEKEIREKIESPKGQKICLEILTSIEGFNKLSQMQSPNVPEFLRVSKGCAQIVADINQPVTEESAQKSPYKFLAPPGKKQPQRPPSSPDMRH